ncbi:DUF420 domain-containing protein [Symmachiella dynata]|uniref:DUF420 domain-containing protein n=1 Tax=Symmachiella dynata TaxID=2527995 RepID=UPI00118B6293|nr:DUF420 domain-containing protein [Symmachiella dynata]QDT49784.1 hypothetical protein Pan258_38390 [Symmachiella dynata]
MADGFLGYPTSLMLDFVVCALVLIVPLLLFSIYLVKIKHNYLLHRNMQILLGVTLLAAVAAFEIDMRLQGGIEEILKKRASPLTAAQHDIFWKVMYVHLFFAITTVPLWATTLILAWKRFPSPPVPSEHSGLHKPLAWLSTIDITMTSVTGLAVYYYGFMV